MPPASSLTDSTVTGSGNYGVYIGASGTYPLPSMPWGTRNDIYANNAGGRQLTTSGSFQNADVNWRGNYWGEDVYYYYNDSRCWNTSPYAKGRLAYRSSTSSPPAGPLASSTQYYLVPNTNIKCAYDTFNVPWNEYSPFSLHGAVGVPVGQTLGSSAGSTHARETSNYVSDPVDSATGSFTHEAIDLSLPGVGIAFDFTRFYNSLDLTSGPLGQGWTHNHSATLTIEANGDVRFRGEDGQQLDYVHQPDGSFTAPTGALSTLASITGGYELSRHDQTKHRFDTAGRLTSVKDRNDQGLTYAYDGSGRLSTITDASGRQATLTYNTDGKLTQVALPDGRTVSYAYTDGRLTSVTDAANKVWTYTYESRGFLEKEIDPLSHTTFRNVYSADGRVIEQYDALNNKTTFSWNETTQTTVVTDPRNNTWQDIYANNVLQKRIDATGEETQFGRDGALNETSVTGPDGSATTMTYDARGNLLTATAPPSLGSVQKTFTYDADNNVTSITDGRGKVTTHSYDADGNVTSTVQDGITVATYTYNAAGQVLTFTDGRNNTTTYTYDANGNLASETDPLGNKTTYSYDAAGRLTSKVEPRGNVQGANPDDYRWTYTYDAAGRLLTETDPLGNQTTYTYDDAGNKLTETNANNRTTSYAYDAANRLTSVTAPDGGVTSYTYDAVGNKLTETNPNGKTTTYAYDSNNRLISVTTPLGNKTTYFYDEDGNQTKVVEPRGNVTGANPDDYATTYTYDAAGRLLTETDPIGSVTTYAYDSVGNRTSVTDANNHTTSYAYDGLNRLTTVSAPGNTTTTYTYDANGNLLSRTDANNHTTSYTYDAANRRTSMTLPLERQWTYTYDAAGNLISTIDANGNTTPTPGDGITTNTYDRAGRLTAIDYSDATPDVTFAYDGVGNRIQMTDGGGTQTYAYDPVNRLTQVTRGTDTFSYTYDLAGNITRRTYPDGTITDYSYDNDSRLANVISGSQTTTNAYDAAGNLTQTTLPATNGYVEERTYDRAGRLARVKNAKGSDVLSDFNYTLDPVGNPTQVVRAGTLPGTTTYGYDTRDRLTEACFQASCPGATDPFIRWTYDPVGNRLTETRPSGTTTYAYNAADELTQAGSTTFGYDEDGNQTSAGGFTFTYDLANRLTATTVGGPTTAYGYDGDGNRIQASASGQTTNFLWDTNHQLPQLALERDGAGAVQRRYIYGSRRVSVTAGSATDYYHYDSLGSVANVTSTSGAPQWTYAYEPYGITRSQTQDDPAALANSMKFAGELVDTTGLYHLRARQYDPVLGRFLQVDPREQPLTAAFTSPFVYADNRPVFFIDPSGESSQPSSAGQESRLNVLSPGALPCLSVQCGGRRPATPAVVYPYRTGVPKRSYPPPGQPGWIHPTAGLPGYPAIDFAAPAGTPVLAVQTGTIREWSGHDPKNGPVGGIHGPFGWSIYLRADAGGDYYYTHLGTRTKAPRQRVRAGQMIGTVGNYATWGGVDHVHLGVKGGRVSIRAVFYAPQVP